MHFLSISWFCNFYFLLPLRNISEVPYPFKISNTELTSFILRFFFSSYRTLSYSSPCSTDQTSDWHLIQFWISIHHTWHQIIQHHHHHRKEAFMCQCNPGFLCARFNPPQRNTQPARREHVENVFNTYKSNTNRSYRVLCPVFPVFLTLEKSNALLW